ncbi:putative nitrate transporter 1.4-like [Capsicum annuum]|nr:putative nitrate transporter 1.4-like [Capsicum annuum]
MTEEQEKIARKLRSLELTMKNLQGLGGYKSVSYKDLCMFPSVHLPLGFKMPKFEKYDGHGDPIAHLRRYCNQLRGAREKEELLMVYFGESLSGLASKWFVDQDIDKYKKKNTESFREYAIKWRKQAGRVKPPMKESKIVEAFIQAQDETYYQHLLPALGKPFIEVLKMGEMIEGGIKTGRIVSFATLKATTQAIQKGSGSIGGNKNEKDVSAIAVGQQAWAKGPHHRYPRAQTQVYAQAPQNFYQNPLYLIPPPPYQVYNAQPYIQPPSYPHSRAPTLPSHPPTPYTYRSPFRPGFKFKPNNEMR